MAKLVCVLLLVADCSTFAIVESALVPTDVVPVVSSSPSAEPSTTHPMDGDISVIHLDTTLVYSSQIQPVPIPPQGFQLPNDLLVTHAGWGTTSAGGSASAILRDVTIFTIDRDLCTARYASLIIPQRVTENMICAGILDEGGKDACQGDSGGPLYYQDILFGIVSWGRGCADAFYPGVSTATSSYTDWIVATAA